MDMSGHDQVLVAVDLRRSMMPEVVDHRPMGVPEPLVGINGRRGPSYAHFFVP
jgi:hypothetical protein